MPRKKANVVREWYKKHGRFAPAVAVMLIFGIVGTYMLVGSHAATPTANFEAENGTLSGNVTNIADAAASGGHGVKFGSGGSGGSCAVSTPNVPDGPDPWGGCFPGPTTTGVPAGTTLTRVPQDITSGSGWTWNATDKVIYITSNNAVVSGLNISGGLVVRATAVTVKNSFINNGQVGVDVDNSTSWSLTLQDSEVYGGHVDLTSIGDGNLTLLRVKAHGGHNGLQCDELSTKGCTITDSYIYGQEVVNPTDPHLGGILTDGGPFGMTITHNSVTCDAPDGCTGDINLIPNFATAQNITISNNLLGASDNGSYCTYGGDKPTSPFPHGNHIVYQNNIFQRGASNKCGFYGPVTDFNFSGVGNVWTNNKYADGTVLVCTAADECM